MEGPTAVVSVVAPLYIPLGILTSSSSKCS